MGIFRELVRSLCRCDEKQRSAELAARVDADWRDMRAQMILLQRENRKRLRYYLDPGSYSSCKTATVAR